MRIVAAGTRFFPAPHPGDKTFWLHLFRRLVDEGHVAHILNVDRRAKPVEHLGEDLTIETVPAVPVYFRAGPQAARYNPESQEIGAITNYGSKTLTIPRLARRIQQIVRSESIDVVHLIDNLGPFAPWVAQRVSAPVFGSAITYDPRYPLYDRFLSASFRGFHGVAATSDRFRDRLIEIGLPRDRVHTVRWGADPRANSPAGDRASARRKLGAAPDSLVVFWSGYIQQVTARDFEVAYRAVRAAQRSGARIEAWFCFKPAHFRPEFARLEAPGVHLRGGADDFERARDAADLFLSPLTRRRSIPAPPLTWVETLLRGTPILTTPCDGIDEALGGGAGGSWSSVEALPDQLARWAGSPGELEAMRPHVREWAEGRYSLAQSAAGLCRMWAGTG